MTMSMLHAAQFADAYRPVVDGVVGVVSNYAREIHERYGRSVVVVPEQKNAPSDDPFPVVRFPSISILRSNGYRLTVAPELAVHHMKQLMDAPLDIIHAHSPFRMGELALKLGNLRRLPVVSTFHSQYKDDFLNVTGSRFLAELGVEYLVHRFWNRVPYMMVPTDFSGRVLRDYGWEGTYRIQPNGTDMSLPSPDEMAAARREGGELLGIPEGVPVLLFVGQHRWVKNPGEIIEAAAVLNARGVDFLQVFIGGGRDAAEISRMAGNAGVAGRVRFLGVIKDRDLLGRYYARADLFTFPSSYDVDPLVVKEAAAWSTPSIVARNSSAAERIIDGVNGFVTGPDAEEMASLIAGILERPDWMCRVGEEARRSVYLSWETVVKNLVDTYREIIDDWRVELWHGSLGKSAAVRHRPSRIASRRSERLKNQQLKRVQHKLGPDRAERPSVVPSASPREPVRHRRFRTKTGRNG